MKKLFLPALLFFLITLATAHADLTTNNIRYHSFDNDVGATVVDSTGTANSTNATTRTLVAGKIGTNALVCTATQGIIYSSGTQFAFANNWTMSFWIKNSTSTTGAIFGATTSGAQKIELYFAGANTLTFVSNPTGTANIVSVRYEQNNLSWTHFILERNGTTITVWRDGVVKNMTTGIDTGAYTGTDRATLCRYTDFGQNVNATIDEVGFWSRGLSQTEINTLYNNGSGLQYPYLLFQNLTISINETRSNTLIAGFSYNYTNSNASDTQDTIPNFYCTGTSCSVTNITGLLNISVYNVSSSNYFSPPTNNNYQYDGSSNNSYTFQTWSNSINISANNSVNSSIIIGLCVNTSNSSSSFVSCNSTGSIVTIYNIIGTQTVTVYDIGSGDGNPDNGIYYNQTFSLTNFNSTMNTTVSQTYQALLNVTATQLYTNITLGNFNVTNNFAKNSTPSTLWDIIPANIGPNNISVVVGGNFSSGNVTCNGTALSLTSCIVGGFFDTNYTIGASFGSTSISNFTVQAVNNMLGLNSNQTTTRGNISFYLLQGYNYYFAIQANGYAYANNTLVANASQQTFNFSLLTSDVVNITFFSETNGSVVAGPNITLNLVSTPQSASYTTVNGSITTEILSPSSYTATYSATSFATRNYQFTLVNNTFVNLRLPMLLTSGATTVTITVTDKSGSLLGNATVKAYIYDITTNSYILNQVGTSNSQGILTMTLQLNGPNYYFTVDYQGVTRLVTVPSQIYSSSLSLSVPLTTQAFSSVINGIALQGSIVNTTPYGLYTFTWVDGDNTATQGCLYAYQFNGLARNPTLYNSSCSATSSGSVNTGINNASNISYYLYGIVTKGGVDYTLDTKLITPNQSSVSEAQSPIWLFVMLLIIVVMASIFRKSPAMAVFIVGLVPVLFSSAGLIAIPLAYTTPMFVIALVIAVVIGQPWK